MGGESELIQLPYTYLTFKHCIFNSAFYGGMDEVHEICLLLRASEDLYLDLFLKLKKPPFSELSL